MRFTRKQIVCLIIPATAVIICSLAAAQVRRIPATVDEDNSGSVDTTQLTMQAKLNNSQKVLEGLVTHDFKTIEKAARVLSTISMSPPPDLTKAGDRTDEQVYQHFRMEFARLAGQLEGHARREELEATAYVHQNLTATCIACHDYIRDYH